MSTNVPFGSGGEGGDLFRALGELFSDPQRLQWEFAAELARTTASAGAEPGNVEPADRIRLDELMRVADLNVAGATGLDTNVGGRAITPLAVRKSEWATRTLDDWKPLLTSLVTALGTNAGGPLGQIEEMNALEGLEGLPVNFAQIFGQAIQAIGPAMLGMQLGMSIGNLAQRALGQYDVPIPRPFGDQILFVPENITAFALSWSLPVDDVYLWVCVREVTHHALMGIEHVRAHLSACLDIYASNFRPDARVFEEKLRNVETSGAPDIESLQALFGDPSSVLSEMVTDEQRSAAEDISAIVAAMEGWVDHIMDTVGSGLIASYRSITEAMRRLRVERSDSEKYLDVLFGLEMGQQQFDRGNSFVDGVLERQGAEGLAQLWESPENIPTPAEIDAPGLWLERIALED